MSAAEALKRRRGRHSSGRMGGGGRVQYKKTPSKNIHEVEQKKKVDGEMNDATKRSYQI